MSKLIVSEFVSLNGVIEAPGGEHGHPHTGWTFKSHYGDDHYQYKQDEIDEAETLLLGRKTYEGFSSAWPEREGPFAETKELVAGYWLWEVKSMDEAIEWVKRCPNPMEGESEIEIRQVFEAEDFGDELTPELREQDARLRAQTEGQA